MTRLQDLILFPISLASSSLMLLLLIINQCHQGSDGLLTRPHQLLPSRTTTAEREVLQRGVRRTSCGNDTTSPSDANGRGFLLYSFQRRKRRRNHDGELIDVVVQPEPQVYDRQYENCAHTTRSTSRSKFIASSLAATAAAALIPFVSLSSGGTSAARADDQPSSTTTGVAFTKNYPGDSSSLSSSTMMISTAKTTSSTKKTTSIGNSTSSSAATATTSVTATAATTATTTTTTPLEESISGFVAGAALTCTKTVVKYPLDTVTVRLQMPNSPFISNNSNNGIMGIIDRRNLGMLFEGSFRGIAIPLIANIPAGAVFFAMKDAVKSILLNSSNNNPTTGGRGGAPPLPKWIATCIAVGVAQFPYWLVRNPSDVVKTRQQAGLDGYGDGVNAVDAYKQVLNAQKQEQRQQQRTTTTTTSPTSLSSIIDAFYLGYWENIFYAYPADVIKFVCYEQLSGGRKNLPPLEGAVLGAISTATAQYITTPLDVVRNRVMAQQKDKKKETKMKTADDGNDDTNMSSLSTNNNCYISTLLQLYQDEGYDGLFAGSIPRVCKSILSGAIQFATYEETKQSIMNRLVFQNNNNKN